MNLIKEALADAKAVKEIAKQNAISTLTEAFAPQMQGMLSRRLAEEDEEDVETNIEPAAPVEEPATPDPEMDMEDDSDIDEILSELEGEVEDEDDSMDTEIEEILGEVEGEMEEDEPEVEDDFEAEPEVEDDFEDELDEILREMDDETSEESDETEKMTAENRRLTRKLKEAYSTISKQKRILNEVGILNARLLYATKILGKYDLSESQKIKVLESLDRATTLREAKLVYATISESLSKKKVSGSKITEGASRPIKSVSRSSGENQFVNKSRWQQLAGITAK